MFDLLEDSKAGEDSEDGDAGLDLDADTAVLYFHQFPKVLLIIILAALAHCN